jgi:hypothetical protein
LDEIAVYQGMMDNRTITRHYEAGTVKPQYADVVISDGGIYWPLTDRTATVAFDYVEDIDLDFTTGTSINLTIDGDRVFLTDPAVSGSRVSEIRDLGELGSIVGSRISWDATDTSITVEVSTNLGNTWTTATNGGTVPGLSAGSTAGKFLQIRESFAVTGNSYASVLDKLRVVVYTSKNVSSVNSGLVATSTNEVILGENEYNLVNINKMGALLNGGTITIPATPTEYPLRTVEYWFKDYTYVTGATWSTVYINGVKDGPFSANGDWTHAIGISSDPINAPLVINGNEVAHLAVYNTPLDAQQAMTHYLAGLNRNIVSALEMDTIGIAEAQPTSEELEMGVSPTKAYAFAWHVVANGQ